MSSLYACLYRPPSQTPVAAAEPLAQIAEAFSPRYELRGPDLVSIDIRGLERLLGPPRTIGEELRREAAERGMRAQVAIAGTDMAALVLALSRPGLTVVPAGREAETIAPIPVGILQHRCLTPRSMAVSDTEILQHWGIRTLGDLAALPSAALSARLGARGRAWQGMARGEDRRPLVPTRPEERFEASLDLEWPIEGLEPLSFVLTRLLEPLSTRLERSDRGVAVLHVVLQLVGFSADEGPATHTCRLELPSPMREVRALRTLALLDLEAHPPSAPIERVTVTIDPTPGRILQHTLFARPHPTPEQLSTLLGRLGALLGADRIGRPVPVDSSRPGAFAMQPFAIDPCPPISDSRPPCPDPRSPPSVALASSLRRCRQPVPARVAVGANERPLRVTADRQGWAGGMVTSCVGPWRTSGCWWEDRERGAWDRDEWDVALADGAVYRIFRDRSTLAWFIDAIVD